LGDRGALEAVLVNVAPAIQRFGLRMCRNVHDAEDVLQDTLLNVAPHLGDFEGRSSLSSWVFSLARSACTSAHRASARRRAARRTLYVPRQSRSKAPVQPGEGFAAARRSALKPVALGRSISTSAATSIPSSVGAA
jgi:RNA polymerase sigma-70 factor (ECF subfamily)